VVVGLLEMPSMELESMTSPLPREVLAKYRVVIAVIHSKKDIKYYLNSAKISA
tara:strand:+ start:323 stop:481 length:159 start_codon:yes stop_codon:yes gene_type:complete